MFEQLKKYFTELMKNLGLSVPDDKKDQIDEEIKKIADQINENKADPDALKKGFEALGAKLQDLMKDDKKDDPDKKDDAKQDESKPEPSGSKDMEDLKEMVKALTTEITNIKTQYETTQKSALEEKAVQKLNEAVRKGKISIKSKEKYKGMLMKNFDDVVAILDDMPENATIAKSNTATENPPKDPTKVPKLFGSVDDKILEAVNQDFAKKM